MLSIASGSGQAADVDRVAGPHLCELVAFRSAVLPYDIFELLLYVLI